MAEKKTVVTARSGSVSTAQSSVGYTEDEERIARRKVDYRVLPLIVLMFIFLQFDRTNLGNALTDTFKKDVHIDGSDVNTGQTLFTLGIFALELPSNVVAQRLGPQRWIPMLQVAWGAVTMGQAALVSRAGFLATRFLLAAFEAGFIPGMAYYLTGFYRTRELALRFAIFWSVNNIAGILSGVLALGLLNAGAKSQLHGWQILFFTEGGLTIIVAIIAALILPASVFDARRPGRSLVGRVIFSERDVEVLAAAVADDDPNKPLRGYRKTRLADVKDTFLDWRLYPHCVAAFLSSVMITPLNTYGPSLVKSLGYKGFTANGMMAPGAAVGLIVSLALAYFSDRTGERGLFIASSMAASAAGCFWLALPPLGTSKHVLYGGYIATAGFMATAQGINAAWLSSRVSEQKRPIALACIVSCVQLAGFAGSNVFKPSNAPRYRPGLVICGACVLAGGVVILLLKLVYAYLDERRAKRETSIPETSTPHATV